MAVLEASSFAGALRGSTWAYPLVNAAHIFGVALLVGGSVPLALRLIGVWKSAPAAPLWRVLVSTAGIGFVLAVSCGFLLFITSATRYVQSGLFLLKMAVVAAGAANYFVLRRLVIGSLSQVDANGSKRPVRIRLAAFLLLLFWPAALILGRLVGYF